MRKCKLSLILKRFLDSQLDLSRPVILALSGGPDSMALFHLLESYSKPMQLHVLHVDHGWREESVSEAAWLKGEVEAAGFPFHLKRLQMKCDAKSLEDAAREERLAVYRALSQELGAQAVILGHQADDQAETVIKRLLEGARVSALAAMDLITEWDGLTLWRPLLGVRKRELEVRAPVAVQDPSNQDPRYLRSRLRHDILPGLSQRFEKEVVGSLCRVAEECSELREFISLRVTELLQEAITGPWGEYWELGEKTAYEVRELARAIASRAGCTLSRDQLNCLLDAWRTGAANVTIASFYMDRQRLFYSTRRIPQVTRHLALRDGMAWGDWTVHLESVSVSEAGDWRSCWQGTASMILPEGEYVLGSYDKHLSRLWTAKKIPALLRNLTPVVWSSDQKSYEFLTGRGGIDGQVSSESFFQLRLLPGCTA